ncbi:MAG: hypothetical protein IPO30_17990 [Hyphomonadaceae bacterium]|nr:hypothetical protein [Hyphomonadaceae bacterium]
MSDTKPVDTSVRDYWAGHIEAGWRAVEAQRLLSRARPSHQFDELLGETACSACLDRKGKTPWFWAASSVIPIGAEQGRAGVLGDACRGDAVERLLGAGYAKAHNPLRLHLREWRIRFEETPPKPTGGRWFTRRASPNAAQDRQRC